MKSGFSESNNNDVPPEEIWKTIVRVTDCVGTDEAKSIRVLLYLALVSRRKDTFVGRLKSYCRFGRRGLMARRKRVPTAPKGCPMFAFLYDTPSNTNNLLPVYRAALKAGWKSSVVTGENVDHRGRGVKRDSWAVSVSGLRAFTTIKERFAAFTGAQGHYSAVSAEFDRVAPRWAPLVRCCRAGIVSELASAMVAIIGLTRLYAAWEPSCVITTSNMWPFDCGVFTEAHRQGIPSFIIQHGVIGHFWWPFVATKMLLWGQDFEDEMVELGAPASMLTSCGMPAADGLFSRHQACDGSKNVNTATTFLILSHSHGRFLDPELFAEFLTFLKAVVVATPSIQWFVKLHPNEDDSFYQRMLEGSPRNFSIHPKSINLEDAIDRSDVAVTLFSTAGLEAMMMRRPLVVCDVLPSVRDSAWWPASGGGSYVPTIEAMLDFVTQASSDAEFVAELVARQDEFLDRSFENKGQAANAVLRTIEAELLDSRNTTDRSIQVELAPTKVTRDYTQ